jgi:hypothetical protein
VTKLKKTLTRIVPVLVVLGLAGALAAPVRHNICFDATSCDDTGTETPTLGVGNVRRA